MNTSTGLATEESSINTSSGAGDEGKIPALDATGRLNTNMMPVGVSADTKTITTSEDLSSGNFVNVYDVTGTPTARKADATTVGKQAVGFVLASTTSGQNAEIYFESTNNQLSGLTGGDRMYLDTTAGVATATPPSASGNVVQFLGMALSASEISFEPNDGIVLA